MKALNWHNILRERKGGGSDCVCAGLTGHFCPFATFTRLLTLFNFKDSLSKISLSSFHAKHCVIVPHCSCIQSILKRGNTGSFNLSSAENLWCFQAEQRETDHPGYRSPRNNRSFCSIQISLTIFYGYAHINTIRCVCFSRTGLCVAKNTYKRPSCYRIKVLLPL